VAITVACSALIGSCSCRPITFDSFGEANDIATKSIKRCFTSDNDAVDAGARGDTDRVRRLVDAPDKVDQTDAHGLTPLYCASVGGHAEAVDVLIGLGADTNHHVHSGDSPLLGALRNGSTVVVALLLEHHARVDDVGRDGETPLMTASATGAVANATVLLDHGALPNQARRTFDATTPGSRPPSYSHRDDTRSLDAAETPIGIAAFRNDEQMFTLLIDRGADPNTPGVADLLHGDPAVNRSKLVRVLVDRDVAIIDSRALVNAAKVGDTELIGRLLGAGSDPNVSGADGTALLWATAFAPTEAIDALLAAGADPDDGGVVDQTLMVDALNFAVETQQVARVAQGRDVFDGGGVPFKVNVPPIVVAATWGRTDVIDRLIAAGADVDARAGPYSAVYLATVFNHSDALVHLLQARANPKPVVDGTLLSPRQVAARLGYTGVEQLLAQAGG